MLAHAGGAATIDAPVWLLAYASAALVLLVTVTLRGRMLVAAVGAEGGAPGLRAPECETSAEPAGLGRIADVLAGVLAVGLLAVVVAAALLGPRASAANLAPSAALTVWWVGLPLACVVAGDVMASLDPFGRLARLARLAWHPPFVERLGGRREHAWSAWTAAPLLAVWAWWVLAFHDGRSPRALGWFVVAYTLAAVGGAVAWGRPWLRGGEAFGALSSTLARTRTPVPRAVPNPDGRVDGDTSAAGALTAVAPVAALVAVWLGATAFDLFSGTRAWVEHAADSTGWTRTGRATGCLIAAMALAGMVVTGTARLAAGPRTAARHPSGSAPARPNLPSAAPACPASPSAAPAGPASGPAGAAPRASVPADAAGAAGGTTVRVREAVVVGWSAATAGLFVGHGIPVLLLDGQFALSLASDPFGRGWDLFGTGGRTIDYSPLSPGLVGAVQIAATAGGAAWGVVIAARMLRSGEGPGGRAALRALWVVGVALAVAASAGVAALSADLE